MDDVGVVNGEPVALVGAINVALGATIAVLVGLEVVSAEVGGLLLAAMSAWIGVAAWLVRARVTPVNPPPE